MLPFENESETFKIAGLTIENRLDRVSMYGSIDITKDKKGLKNLLELAGLLKHILSALKAGKLPDKIPVRLTDEIKNPFRI